jgi:DNA-binding SARP family transcriptional activator
MALLLSDDAAAREPMDAAWRAAHQRGDLAVQHLLAAMALLAIEIEMADFRGLAVWVDRFQAGEAAAPAQPDPVDRLRLDAARLVLPTLDHRFAYDSASARDAAARLLDALRQGHWPAGAEHALLAKVLHEYHGMEYDEAACERLAALATPGLQQADADWRARWWVQLEDCLAFWGHPDAAAQARDELATLAARSPSTLVAWTLAVVELRHALRGSDLVAQDRAYAQVDRLRTLQRPGRALQGLRWQTMLLLQRGRPKAALDKADLLLSLSADVEVPERDRGVYHDLRAQALAGLGRWDEALQVLDTMHAHQTGAQGRIVQALVSSMQAAAALSRGAPDAQALCVQALRDAAANAWPRFLGYFPELAAQVADAGLRARVEPEFTTAAIRSRRLVPTPRWRDDWPWRLKVRVLGPLAIERDGQALVTTGKVPKKPLELLALLAAHGGRPLDVDAVIDDLWPSLDANTPRASLDMAVLRLRKLLDLPDAVLQAEGRLSLHPSLVWTDVGAFELLADEAARQVDGAADHALRLHADRLRGSEALAGLNAQRRRQLLQRLATLALDHARLRLQAGDAAEACRVLQHALRCDAASVPLAQALAAAQLDLARQVRAP